MESAENQYMQINIGNGEKDRREAEERKQLMEK